jgi:hypothetical protein
VWLGVRKGRPVIENSSCFQVQLSMIMLKLTRANENVSSLRKVMYRKLKKIGDVQRNVHVYSYILTSWSVIGIIDLVKYFFLVNKMHANWEKICYNQLHWARFIPEILIVLSWSSNFSSLCDTYVFVSEKPKLQTKPIKVFGIIIVQTIIFYRLWIYLINALIAGYSFCISSCKTPRDKYCSRPILRW